MRHFLSDHSLSWQAKGLLAYLLEDDDMYTSVAGTKLCHKSSNGRDACFKILDELYKARYLYRKKSHGEYGLITGNHFFIFEVPYTDEDIGLLSN